jgi:endonuclease-3
MMVGFGQVICLPVGPRCDICLLGERKLCPSRVSNVKAEGRKEVLYTFTNDDDDEPNVDAGSESLAKIEVHFKDGEIKTEQEVLLEASEDALVQEAVKEEFEV